MDDLEVAGEALVTPVAATDHACVTGDCWLPHGRLMELRPGDLRCNETSVGGQKRPSSNSTTRFDIVPLW